MSSRRPRAHPASRAALVVALLAVLRAENGTGQTVPPAGGNFQVNTYTTGTREHASVQVVDLEGNFVVVWHDNGPGDGDNEIFAQRYHADGSSDGLAFRVNIPTPAGDQAFPDVASDFAGNFVVVWQGTRLKTSLGEATISKEAGATVVEIEGEDPSGENQVIQGRRFDSTGPVGGDFVVMTSIQYYQYDAERPEVGMDLTGAFVVVWQNTLDAVGSDTKILAQRFDAAGIPIGREFLVSPEIQTSDVRPSLAKNLVTGDFVVVWDGGFCTPEGGTVCAQRFAASGVALGERFQVEEDTSGSPGSSEVASSFDGDFLVVWQQGSPDSEILGKRFDETGDVVNPDFQVNTYTTGNQTRPVVTAGDLDGNFSVAWQSFESGSNEIRARWFADDFQDDANTMGTQDEAAVAADFDGNFIVAWDGPDPADRPGIFAQRYVEPVKLEINDFSVDEGDPAVADTTAVFTVRVSNAHPVGADVTVDFRTEDNTATFLEDYGRTTGSLVFNAGTPLAQPIEIPLTGDTIFEPDETFFLQLFDVENAVIVRRSGIGTIVNDDPPGVLRIDDAARLEGDSGSQSLIFRVSISAVQQLAATATFATVDETATGGEDYESTTGVLNVPPGFSEVFLSVRVFGDTVFEEDETFRVVLSDPTNATLSIPTPGFAGRGTILTDETCPIAPTIAPDSALFPVAGGTGSVAVSDPASCVWEALSNDDWLTILSTPNCPPGSPSSCVQGGTGDGQVEYGVAANGGLDARLGTLTVADEPFTAQQEGTLCNFVLTPAGASFLSAGGSGEVAVTASNQICSWTAESLAEFLEILGSPDCPAEPEGECAHGGTGDGVVQFSVAPNLDFDRQGTLLVAINNFVVDQNGMFFDDFDDGVLDPEWIYTGDFWSESDSRLRADPTEDGELAQAIARPAFIGCVECTVSTRMRTDIFSQGLVTLLGWYLNDDNLVSLTMNEFANTWTLRQRVAGTDAATVSGNLLTIDVDRDYDVAVEFDGADFTVFLDGALALAMPAAPGSLPDGTVGFRVAGTEASFAEIMVLSVTTGNLPAAVTITAPADGSTAVEGAPIGFAATALDAEDGDLAAGLSWTSDADGVIGTGPAPTALLSLGDHAIHVEVLDSGDLPAFDDILLTVVPNLEPVVTITGPPDAAVVFAGVAIGFSATAADDGDGDLAAGLAWTSSLDGVLGTGGAFSAPLSAGIHSITATVTDSGGLTDSDSITVEALPNVFVDGFESGDTSAWSAALP